MATTNEKHTEEERTRIDTIRRHVKGERPRKIYTSLGKSEAWFYKWLGRYKQAIKRDETEWFKDRSRALKNVPNKTEPDVEKFIINVRKSLVEGDTGETKYRHIGPDEIQFRLHQLKYLKEKTPSTATISRIIKRNGLVIQKRRRYIRCKSKKGYTLLNPTKINELHQMDFVGLRYIKGYGAISFLNSIDLVRGEIQIEQYASKSMDFVLEFLLAH